MYIAKHQCSSSSHTFHFIILNMGVCFSSHLTTTHCYGKRILFYHCLNINTFKLFDGDLPRNPTNIDLWFIYADRDREQNLEGYNKLKCHYPYRNGFQAHLSPTKGALTPIVNFLVMVLSIG